MLLLLVLLLLLLLCAIVLQVPCYFTIFGTNLLCHKSPAALVKTVAVPQMLKSKWHNELANTRFILPINQS